MDTEVLSRLSHFLFEVHLGTAKQLQIPRSLSIQDALMSNKILDSTKKCKSKEKILETLTAIVSTDTALLEWMNLLTPQGEDSSLHALVFLAQQTRPDLI